MALWMALLVLAFSAMAQDAQSLPRLNGGYYVPQGVATNRWPEENQPLLRVLVKGNEITVDEIRRTRRPGLGDGPSPDANARLPIISTPFHGVYTSNSFMSDTAFGLPMIVINPDRFMFGRRAVLRRPLTTASLPLPRYRMRCPVRR
jgi:hypothetical protein